MDPDVVLSICIIKIPSEESGLYEVLNSFHTWHGGLIFMCD